MKTLHLLALSGSLRKSSYNSKALLALKALSPAHITIELGDISQLPLFNPDREDEYIAPLETLKFSIGQADGLIIASPEYAHGISGPMKNALDWLVSGVAFPDKPIMLVNTSPRAHHAQDALAEVLTTMSANIIQDAYTCVPLLGSEMTVNDIVHTEALANILVSGLECFVRAITLLTEHENF